jgi:V/A-type H+-transporting ATPase subunit K
MGDVYAMIGAAIAVALTGAGASIGTGIVQRAAAGVITEEPEKYGKTLVFQLIASSAALYGFVVGFLVILTAVFGGGYDATAGLIVMAGCLPIGVVGMISSIAQAKVCASCVIMIGKKQELSGRALTMAIFIELFALFALIVSILSVMMVPNLGR